MTDTGIIRNVDGLGRLSIPVELRRKMKINTGEPLEFFVESDDKIVVMKHYTTCAFCGCRECSSFKDGHICTRCLGDIKTKEPSPVDSDGNSKLI